MSAIACVMSVCLSPEVHCRGGVPGILHRNKSGVGHRSADKGRENPKGPQFEVELRAVPVAAENGEVFKADGQLSDDEDAALTRTIAALVLNLRGIDAEIRESGLNMLCHLALRGCAFPPPCVDEARILLHVGCWPMACVDSYRGCCSLIIVV